MNGKERFSYVRYPASYFIDQSAKAEIFYFKIDKSLSKVRDDLAGVVKVKMISLEHRYLIKISISFWGNLLS